MLRSSCILTYSKINYFLIFLTFASNTNPASLVMLVLTFTMSRYRYTAKGKYDYIIQTWGFRLSFCNL